MEDSRRGFIRDWGRLLPRNAAGEVETPDTAVHATRLLRPIQPHGLRCGSRHGVLSTEKRDSGVLSGADEWGQHRLSCREKGISHVAARRGRPPAVCRRPAMGCVTYSSLGDAVVCSAWGKGSTATSTREGATFRTPRLSEKRLPPMTEHLPWGKFTMRQRGNLSPTKTAALALPQVPTAPGTTSGAAGSPDSPNGTSLSQLGGRASSKRGGLRTCQAVFDRAFKVLTQEQGYLERIREIVEEVRDAAHAVSALNAENTDAGNGVDMVHDVPAVATVPLLAAAGSGVPAAVTTEASSVFAGGFLPHTVGCERNNLLSADSAFAVSPSTPKNSPEATSQEQRKCSGASGELIPNAAMQGAVSSRVKGPTHDLLGAEAVRGVGFLPDEGAAAGENKEPQPNGMEKGANDLPFMPSHAERADVEEAVCGFHTTAEGCAQDDTRQPVPGAVLTAADAVDVSSDGCMHRVVERLLTEEEEQCTPGGVTERIE